MQVYTVRMPGGTKDHEFEAYKRLLEEAGVDLSSVPRVQEPGTRNRWLYSWHDRGFAERFARELRLRTRSKDWEVHSFELPEDEYGPIAPLEILVFRDSEGETFQLTPTSQDRIMRKYPNARLAKEVFWSKRTREEYEQQHGSIWTQTAIVLMGLGEEQVMQLGGYRIVEPNGTVLHESETVTK